MADEDRSFHTSTPEANRAADQGRGVGAREIAAQRDPGEPAPGQGDQLAQDAEDDADEELALGRSERPDDSQGSKTRKANKDIVSGREP
jgi:hypothetical protein